MLKWLGGGSSASNANGASGGGGDVNLTHVGKVFHVNDYQVVVEELIAEGGFAVVYRTRSSRGQQYALKRMAVNNEKDLYVARQEIAITKALSDCPNSVTYISSTIRPLSSDVHEVLILMQLYTGQSVVQLLNSRLSKRSTLSEREVLKIFSDVVVAVGRLHHRTKQIIHRDLKIENILSDKQGHYILCDYGSCTVNNMHPETMGAAECEDEIARFTTLAYRAPEMVSLYSGKTITTKADIWALGCLLYKLCFMTTPFGEQALAIVSAQFTIPENSPYSDELHSFMRYMLEADPDKRPTIWQVTEVVCRMLGRPNTLPNVFRSPKPPAVLPRARKANETKPVSPTSKSSQSTPASSKPKGVVTVTTTSISSRQRPRARGVAGQTNTSTSTTSATAAPPEMTRRYSNSPPAMRHNPHSMLEMPLDERVSHLRVESQMNAQASKSWDSGLDMFGAVPFAPTQQCQPTTHEQCPDTSNFANVRRDLFGSVPFPSSSPSFAPSPGPAPSQPSRSVPPPQLTVDDFGAQPFVTCS